MEDRLLAMCELSNDLLFHKIPSEQLGRYVDWPLRAGQETAGRFAGCTLEELYEQYGISVRYSGDGKHGYGVILRGQSVMGPQGCAVEVYRDSIQELAAHSAWNGTALTEEKALQVHLAHEFFHIWEYQEGRSVSEELEAVTTMKVLGFRRTAHIARCAEIAAHAFAKEFLGLPFLPNFYDYLYLMDTGKMSRSAFEELSKRMRARLGCVGPQEGV